MAQKLPLRKAQYAGHCHKCKQTFPEGAWIRWSNRPYRGYIACCKCVGADPLTGEYLDHAPEIDETPEIDAVIPPVPPATGLQALADMLAPYLPGVNPDELDAKIREAIERIPPSRIEVVRPDQTTAVVKDAHFLMPRLLKLLGAGVHVYLWGPAGTGKTTACLQAAEALGRPAEVDSIDPSTPRSDVRGYRNLDKTNAETAFSRAWSTPNRTYVLEEADNGPGSLQNYYNSALANGHAPFPWGLVARAEGFGFAANGNTPGLGRTDAYPDRKPMSPAFRDRLYFIHWPLDTAIEARACGVHAPEPPKRREWTCTHAEWFAWIQKVREYCAHSAPTIYVGTRANTTGVVALSLGETPEEVAHGLVFRGADPALVAKVLAACPLPESKA